MLITMTFSMPCTRGTYCRQHRMSHSVPANITPYARAKYRCARFTCRGWTHSTRFATTFLRHAAARPDRHMRTLPGWTLRTLRKPRFTRVVFHHTLHGATTHTLNTLFGSLLGHLHLSCKLLSVSPWLSRTPTMAAVPGRTDVTQEINFDVVRSVDLGAARRRTGATHYITATFRRNAAHFRAV